MAKIGGSGSNADATVQSVTSVGVNPERERKARMIKYTISMTIRVICLILGMVVHGWLQWLLFAAAIFLPYVAVIIANDVKHESEDKAQVVEAPVLRLDAADFKIVPNETKVEN